LGLSLFQFVVLYIGETLEKYKNKQWTLESTIADQTKELVGDTTKQITDSLKKSPERELSIKELEAQIAELE